MSETMLIEMTNLSKNYREGVGRKRVQAVDRLSLTVAAGEVFGFLGPNGAGKSTTIKMLVGLVFPDAGEARLMGRKLGDKECRRQVGYLPENPYFYDHLTAEELLWFGGRTSGVEKHQLNDRIAALLAKVDLFQVRKRQLRTFSKGMLQRAGLALALIHDPQLIILDEPMSGLDPLGRKLVADIILEQKAAGKTVFFSSHILNDIERFCDRAGIIIGGRLVKVDTVQSMLQTAKSLEDVFLQELEMAGAREVLSA